MSATFEARYRADPDPWRTASDPYEQGKIRATLKACGPGPFAAACELGAGIGVLTAALAPRCRALLALDGAPTAVAAATARLAPFPGAAARVAVLPDDLPDGPWDLVVASEVLYYLEDAGMQDVGRWLARALVPGGRVVTVHWTGTAPDLRRDADDVVATLAAVPALQAAPGGAVHLGYRIDVLARSAQAPR